MRVLCLHDYGSCAMHMHATLNCLEERLWKQHGIELVFANSPLSCTRKKPRKTQDEFNDDEEEEEIMKQIQDLNIITSPRKKKSCCLPSNENNKDNNRQERENSNSNSTSRCWWEETDDKQDEDSDGKKHNRWVGLDASLFHLQQLWSTLPQSSNIKLDYSPFVGILGIGQGAALAAILTLLSNSSSDEDVAKQPFLDGLEFAIFIKGFDLIQSTDMSATKSCNRWFEGEPPLCTLHMSLSSQMQHHSSKMLYESFGGDTYPHKTQKYILGSETNQKRKSKRRLTKTTIMKKNSITTTEPIDTIHVHDLNVMGRYIVQQKNKWSQQQRKKITISTLNTITNNINVQKTSRTRVEKDIDDSSNLKTDSHHQGGGHLSYNETIDKENKKTSHFSKSNNTTTITSLQETKMKIQALEQYALKEVLPRAIAANPPKALIATIFQPSLTGAWTGGNKDIDRSIDFTESGGAPCPSSFVLPKEER